MSTIILPMASPKSLKRSFEDTGLGEPYLDQQTAQRAYEQPSTIIGSEIVLEVGVDAASSADSSRLTSPAPSYASSSAVRDVNAQTPQGNTTPSAGTSKKRAKLTFAEKEARRMEKETKDREKAEEKIRKEQEKEIRDRQKAEEKAKKEEEKRAKDLEREARRLIQEEKTRIKEEEKRKKDEEKAKKEEEKNKKAKVNTPSKSLRLIVSAEVFPVTAPPERFLCSTRYTRRGLPRLANT